MTYTTTQDTIDSTNIIQYLFDLVRQLDFTVLTDRSRDSLLTINMTTNTYNIYNSVVSESSPYFLTYSIVLNDGLADNEMTMEYSG